MKLVRKGKELIWEIAEDNGHTVYAELDAKLSSEVYSIVGQYEVLLENQDSDTPDLLTSIFVHGVLNGMLYESRKSSSPEEYAEKFNKIHGYYPAWFKPKT